MPTLLLADDSVTIQRVVELTFADEDIDVVVVGDGDQAIAALEQGPAPDIVLADVGMPGRDGYAVARYIRNTPHLSHVPVLLLTGAFEPVDQEQAAAVGCDGVLAKPFEPQLMVSRVKDLLAGQAAREPGGEGHADVVEPGSSAPHQPSPPQPTPPAEYFDRLDQAFARLTGESEHVPAAGDVWTGRSRADQAAGRDASLSPELSRTVPGAEASDTTSAVEVESARVTAALPPLADAFAALLRAEQTTPPGTPSWPTPPHPIDVGTADLVEQVSRRVLEQLTDRVVRETVAEIVSGVAERLVQAEIDQIKRTL